MIVLCGVLNSLVDMWRVIVFFIIILLLGDGAWGCHLFLELVELWLTWYVARGIIIWIIDLSSPWRTHDGLFYGYLDGTSFCSPHVPYGACIPQFSWYLMRQPSLGGLHVWFELVTLLEWFEEVIGFLLGLLTIFGWHM